MVTYEQLEEVNNKLKTTDIKGSDYVEVNERIKAFRMIYPDGIIDTHLESNIDGVCIFRAQVGYYEEDGCVRWLGSGTAYEKENSTFINKTSYIENCETSAVGRALGMAGFGINKSVASADEVLNAINNQTLTEDEAKEYKLSFGKHNGKTLLEVNEEAPDYIEWLVKNSKDENILKCIEMLFNKKKSDYDVSDSRIELMNEVIKLIDETGTDLEGIKEHYNISSLSETTDEQLSEIHKRLIKTKELRGKVNE